MCGICGFYAKEDRRLLEAMAGALRHRGPDDEGFYEDEFASLGHRRLSIIDLTPHGRQPLCNENSTIWSIVNGEIYNFKTLREELISQGHIFRSHSDSEVIVHAYEQYGEDFALKLNGMFAIAIWDSINKKLILCRDRIGIKPLYYTQSNSGLFFASEIKAILKNNAFKKELNEHGFFQYLAFQCTMGSETMFKGIYKLKPGHILIFNEGKLVQKKYWSLDESRQKDSNKSRVAVCLVNAIKSHLVSDVPIGVLLSGGLDSSSIVAMMHESGVKDIETFTVGFNQPDDEFSFAREVAQRFKTNHHELLIEPKGLEGLLEKIVWHMDEPLADGGAIATYLASSKIKDFVKVVLVGEGGDETLGGYNWHKLAGFPFNLMSVYLRKRLYFYLTTFYKSESRIPFDTFLDLFQDKSNFFEAMSSYEINNILPNSLLMKVDKMTMAHSLEARVPFLDHEFVSQVLGLSHKEKITFCSTKIFFREYMQNRLPDIILKRGKHGFLLPIHKWLNSELRAFTADRLLSSSYVSSLLGPHDIKKLFKKSLGLAAIENNSLLWRLLIFEIWHKVYFKDNV